MWIAVDLDDTLLDRNGRARPGARVAMETLLREGHRVTIWTARFARVTTPDEIKTTASQIMLELDRERIPFSDVWDQPAKPQADLFIGDNLVPYTGNWPKTLAAAHLMMKSRGTVGDVPDYEEHE